MDESLKDLHRKYNEIGKLQQQLPSKREKKDYSEIESEIIYKATMLGHDCSERILKAKSNNTNLPMLPEIENMRAGLIEVERDPYNKVHVINLE